MTTPTSTLTYVSEIHLPDLFSTLPEVPDRQFLVASLTRRHHSAWMHPRVLKTIIYLNANGKPE